ncbi:FHA domain-containing protein [Tahibacter amnicola]|uniref:FHA domain-containing protein n=1 Tax=Tahibacter amnicola TaxID=2976241 RepID=A0ABY6B7Y6_9GAMM|nr:FHA domain-containing protein [Tahibacter amnicola]UXI65882.1 FHA domain-containing protein [Tahibacter amnicola]
MYLRGITFSGRNSSLDAGRHDAVSQDTPSALDSPAPGTSIGRTRHGLPGQGANNPSGSSTTGARMSHPTPLPDGANSVSDSGADDNRATPLANRFDHRRVAADGARHGVADSAAEAPAASYTLVIMSGPRMGLQARIGDDPLIIGRGAESGIRLDDVRISRRHCELWRSEGAVWVRDLGSKNRTILNGRFVYFAEVWRGDCLTIGDTVIEIV